MVPSNDHIEANQFNLNKSQQSHLGEGTEKGKNVSSSKDDKGKSIQLSHVEMWKPIPKRHSIPNKSIESKGAHVSISRYDVLQELDNSLSQNDVQLCQFSKGFEQSSLGGEEIKSINNCHN